MSSDTQPVVFSVKKMPLVLYRGKVKCVHTVCNYGAFVAETEDQTASLPARDELAA